MTLSCVVLNVMDRKSHIVPPRGTMTFTLEMLSRFAVSAVILLGASSSIAAERPASSVRSVSVNLTEMPKPGRLADYDSL